MLALAGWMAAAPALAQEEEGEDAAAEDRETPAYGEERPEEENPTRKARRNIARPNRKAFDPSEFEARGRELQGEYYEIAGIAKAPSWSGDPGESSDAAPEVRQRNWLVWGGAAGLAAAVAGVTGWLLLSQPGAAEPVSVHLDDTPTP